MKRRSVLAITALMVLFAGLGMNRAGWFHAKHAARHGRHHSKAQASALSDAALRHMHYQPLHWRAMLLQH
jgi:hypothetical protein